MLGCWQTLWARDVRVAGRLLAVFRRPAAFVDYGAFSPLREAARPQ
ncbi:hypothetical protein [Kingella potus]|nr:hypothetical protein [Kingella potus]UOP00773.1 hypothetical protein LVJ84_13600 [Kingella potus]